MSGWGVGERLINPRDTPAPRIRDRSAAEMRRMEAQQRLQDRRRRAREARELREQEEAS